MIKINLIPYTLRKKTKSKFSFQELNIPPEVMIGSMGGLFILLIFIHIGLLVINIRNINNHKQLKGQMAQILPQKQLSDKVIAELRVSQGMNKALGELMPSKDILWAQKFNILSDSIPRGVWIRKVMLARDSLVVEGSAISTDNESIINVHKFTANLKGQKDFLKGFVDIELGSITRRRIKDGDIADFRISMRLK